MSLSTVSTGPQQQSCKSLFERNAESGCLQPTATAKVLEGIRKQLLQLEPRSILHSEFPLSHVNKGVLSKNFSAIFTHLVASQKVLDKANQTNPLETRLNNFIAYCGPFVKKLEEIEKQLNSKYPKFEVVINEKEEKFNQKPTHKQLEDEINKFEEKINATSSQKQIEEAIKSLYLREHLPTLKGQNTELKQETESKLSLLAERIALHKKHPIPLEEAVQGFIIRTKKIVPDYVIRNCLEESVKQDESRVERYLKLKSVWTKADLIYNNMHSLAKRLIIAVSTIPHLRDNLDKINNFETCVEAWILALEDISVLAFAKTFIEKNTSPRDLSQWKNSLKAYQELVCKQDRLKELKSFLTPLNQKTIRKHITTMSSGIGVLSREDPAALNLEDEAFKLELKNQRERAINKLTEQRDDVRNHWNTVQSSLIAINHRVMNLERIQNFVIQASNYYLAAEEIRETLRSTRKNNKQRSEHEKIFNEQITAFDTLCNSITQKSLHSLETNYKKALLSAEEINKLKEPATFKNLKDEEFICDEETKVKILAELNAQKARFAEEAVEQNKKIESTFKALKYMYALAVVEINRMGNALQIETKEYNEGFNVPMVYGRESSIGGAIEKGTYEIVSTAAATVTSAAKRLTQVLSGDVLTGTSAIPPALVGIKKEPYSERKSPFELIPAP